MPDEPQCCEHDYRRDVESCPYCELNEAEAALKSLQERTTVLEDALHGEYGTSERWKRACQQVEQERDRLQAELNACTQSAQRLNARVEPLTEERDAARRERDAYRAGGEKLNARLKVLADQLAAAKQPVIYHVEVDPDHPVWGGSGLVRPLTPLEQQLLAERDEARRERDAALALLAEAWEWTTPRVYGKLGYVALHERVKAALEAKEEPDSSEPPGREP